MGSLSLDVINKIKQKQKETETEINDLEATRKHAGVIKMIAPKISEISEIIKNNADGLGFIERRQLLQLFRSHILASPDNYSFTCLLNSYFDNEFPDGIDWEKSEYNDSIDAQNTERLKNLEAQYPNLTVLDIINNPKYKDSVYGQALITFEKNLVTIERTSGCLPFHAYIFRA